SPFLSHRSVPPALPPLSLHDALPISSQRGYPPADPVDSHFPIAWSSPSNQLSSHARGEGPPGCVLDCLLNGLRGTRGPERCSSSGACDGSASFGEGGAGDRGEPRDRPRRDPGAGGGGSPGRGSGAR